MPPDRIALIAVHGVADQQPGDTARALVGLLVAAPPEDLTAPPGSDGSRPRVRYESYSEQRLAIQVDPLRPRGEPTLPRSDATPLAEDRPLLKSFLQSFRADLQRSGWRAASGVKTAWRESRKPPPEVAADRGLAVTNYLLTKHIDNGAHGEAYETICIALDRKAAAGSSKIDVYEMYWADLSRLGGQVPRILTELFTMVFRLSKLGRDTVDEARGRIVAQRGSGLARKAKGMLWSGLAGLQSGLDWLFVNVLALLFLQLILLVAVLGGFALLLRLEPQSAHLAVAITIDLGALLWLGYHSRGAKVSSLVLPLAVLAWGVALLFTWQIAALWTATAALLVLAVATWLSEFGLGVAEDRFPFVRTVGRVLWAATLLVVLAAAWHESKIEALPPTSPLVALGDERLALHSWTHATLFATEVVLAFVKVWWMVAAVLLVLWFLLGSALSFRADGAPKASIATGRLGLAVSLGAFLTLTMAAWALLTIVTNVAADGVAYSSCVLAAPDRPASAPVAASAPAASPAASAPAKARAELPSNACLFSLEAARIKRPGEGRVKSPPTAAQYLDDRFSASTESFALLAGLLSLLLIYLAIIFVPSVLAELKVLVRAKRQAFHRTLQALGKAKASDPAAEHAADLRNRRLGRWLSFGYRHLDVVVWTVVGLGMIVASLVALIFLGRAGADWQIVLPWGGGTWTLAKVEAEVRPASHTLLEPLILSAAGAAAALTALGGFLSKQVPTIRAPLDVVLDVDNYFRDFPRTNIPRARIFSRYAALLGHLQQQGYDAIVVVSHSQGTVISAELLRFLASDGCHPPEIDARPHLDAGSLPRLSLLTLGCPLRQLYASRFPYLYSWVIEPNKGLSGPLATDIGVERWANAFSSGDYVGRWLRSDSADPKDPIGHPMSDLVDDRDGRGLGRIDAYAGFVPMPPAAEMLEHKREIEVCLGLGAHTHYFEPDQSTVAWLVDYLIGAGTRPVEPGSVPALESGAPRDPAVGDAATLPRVLAFGTVIACAVLLLTGNGRRRGRQVSSLADQEPPEAKAGDL